MITLKKLNYYKVPKIYEKYPYAQKLIEEKTLKNLKKRKKKLKK